jgi:polar amino acid transport system substrate-binding protein
MKTLKHIVLPLALIAAAALAHAGPLNLARNEKATEQAIAANIISDLYKRAGVEVNVQPLPAARANAVAKAGEKDGEVGRIQAYADRNPELTKVEPAYYYITTTAFAKSDKGIKVATRDDLKKFKVGIIRGVAHTTAATEGHPALSTVNDADQLYQMLDSGRIDIALDAGVNGPYTVKKLGLKDIVAVGDLARLDLFTILHSGKKDVGAKVAATIKTLKDSGELDKLVKRHEADFLKSGASN